MFLGREDQAWSDNVSIIQLPKIELLQRTYEGNLNASWFIISFPSDPSPLVWKFLPEYRTCEEEITSIYKAFEPIITIQKVSTMLWYHIKT